MPYNTNSFKGTYNEVKILLYLEGITDCEIVDFEKPHNWSEILAAFSSFILENENDRAFTMAQKIVEYSASKGLGKMQKIYWTAKPNATEEDEVVKRYCEYSNPADIVLRFEDGEYLGISLKSYSHQKPMNHKQTSFTTIDSDIIVPDSRVAAFNKFSELVDSDICDISLTKKIVHLADLNYIHAMATGKYETTKYNIHEGFKEIHSVKYDAEKTNNKFTLKISHENGVQKANVYFKTTSSSKPESPKYAIQVSYV